MDDKQKVKQAINGLYKFAGINTQFNGDVNKQVAEVFGELLKEINTCSNAFSWVPRPTGGKATISWVATNMSKRVLEQFSDKQSYTCARVRVAQYQRRLQLAGLGI